MFNATSPTPRADLGLSFVEFNEGVDYFIGDTVFPVTPVNYRTAYASVQPRENFLTIEATAHANGAEFARVNSGFDTVLYDCVDNGLEQLITSQTAAENADFFDVEMTVTKQLASKLKLGQEKRIADKLFSTSTFTGADLYTDVATAWTSTTTANPIVDIQAAIGKVTANCGMPPDSMVVSNKVFGYLLANANLRGSYGVNLGYDEFKSMLASSLNLTNIFIGKATYKSSKPGKAFVGSNVWSDSYCSIFKKAEAGTSMSVPGVGRTFQWTGIAENNASVIVYPAWNRDGQVYRVRQFTDEMLVDAYFGHLLKID